MNSQVIVAGGLGGGPLSDCGWCIYQEPFKGCDWHESSRPSAWAANGKSRLDLGKYQCKTNINFWVMSSGHISINVRMLFIWWTRRLRRLTTSLRVYNWLKWCSQLLCVWCYSAPCTSHHLWSCNLACKWRVVI